MVILKEHIVPVNTVSIRLYDYAGEIFTTIPSRKALKKTIDRGEILIDGITAKTGSWVNSGQLIQLIDLELKPPKTFDFSLEVVYEDEWLAVVNKPAGIIVSGNIYKTMVNILQANIKPSKEDDALKWSRPVHRLDSQTSGLLLVAKTAHAQMSLGQQFEHKEIKKRYIAIVVGKVDSHGFINTPIDGKESLTEYSLIKAFQSLKTEWLSLVDLFPHTGRTHQLRIHMASINHPILGDKLYGINFPILKNKGLFLCSAEICFIHPKTKNKCTIKINTPSKFNIFIEKEIKRWGKYNY